mmetsp:Transcript_113590/g.208788  ORF Transcript_113590/g.208788 Transcript_113590/m.208788 type:complete len:220 (+) Transcript_113590:1922-2581(+)
MDSESIKLRDTVGWMPISTALLYHVSAKAISPSSTRALTIRSKAPAAKLISIFCSNIRRCQASAPFPSPATAYAVSTVAYSHGWYFSPKIAFNWSNEDNVDSTSPDVAESLILCLISFKPSSAFSDFSSPNLAASLSCAILVAVTRPLSSSSSSSSLSLLMAYESTSSGSTCSYLSSSLSRSLSEGDTLGMTPNSSALLYHVSAKATSPFLTQALIRES